jgi:hypothetical protein
MLLLQWVFVLAVVGYVRGAQGLQPRHTYFDYIIGQAWYDGTHISSTTDSGE